MRIAFVSYEYPPDTALGGIATYVFEAARMLAQRGHSVEVFSASPSRNVVEDNGGLRVVRVQCDSADSFAEAVASPFYERHSQLPFDVLEGPDYGADARAIIKVLPSLPLVIKLHTPHFVVDDINQKSNALRSTAGLFRDFVTGKSKAHRRRMRLQLEIEAEHSKDADVVVAPSKSIGRIVQAQWSIPDEKVSYVPLPFTPSAELLSLPVERTSSKVGFFGRIEPRKGVLDLAKATPEILRTVPDMQIEIVGRVIHRRLESLIQHEISDFSDRAFLLPAVSPSQVPALLGEWSICVLPSLYESFGFVCAEAMAAGLPVVASRAGGMSDLLDEGRVGRLIDPGQPKQIAASVIELSRNPELRHELGHSARAYVLEAFGESRVAALQEHSYEKAIERRRSLGPRSNV